MPPRPDRKEPAAGRITRGKTAPNRLRRFDAFLAQYDPGLLRRRDGAFADAPVVDLGYGAEPVTTLQMAECLRRVSPGLPVVGVEIDPGRVARAQPFADALTDFRLGGFDLPVPAARLVRAFNVLRQYDESEAAPALAHLLARTLPGGLVVDGTSDPWGRVWTASLLRRPPDSGDGELEAFVFGTNFNGGFDPDAFQTRLPKSFIHRVVHGDRVFALVEDWKAACRDTRGTAVWGPRAWFTAAAADLARRGWTVMRPQLWPRRGWLVLRRPGLGLVR
ncbi:MAG TPA: hypothetical protein PLQ13_11105 [Candidatus Krumholzibacteria bacterium]|nr:hypothetical protein [Candidatus Krumholzibacteria bacterium]